MHNLIYDKVLETALETFEKSNRRTGRTREIIKKLKPGDLVVLHTVNMKKYFIDTVKEIRKDLNIKSIDFYVCIPQNDVCFYGLLGKTYKNIYFDNAWLFLYFKSEINRLVDFLKGM